MIKLSDFQEYGLKEGKLDVDEDTNLMWNFMVKQIRSLVKECEG